MGRSGGGGGGFSGGGFHSSSGHISSGHVGGSSRSSGSSGHVGGSRPSSSFGGSRPSGNFGGPRPGPGGFGGPMPGFGGPRPRPVYRNHTTVFVNNSGNNSGYQNGAEGNNGAESENRRGSCGTWFIVGIIAFVFFLILSGVLNSKNGGGTTYDSDMDRIYAYAEEQYTEQFGTREDAMMIVMDENDNGQAVMGSKAASAVNSQMSYLWDRYDANYNDDLGVQWGRTLTETAGNFSSQSITPEKGFDSSCYFDELDYVDTPNNLVQGAKIFYEATGVQVYVKLVNYSTIENATSGPDYTGVAFFITVAGVIVIYVIFKFINKRKELKVKELEETNKILNTPLEKYSDTASELAAKYEDKE